MKRTENNRKHESGTVILFVTIALIGLLAFAAWATETGHVWSAQGQMRSTVDASALAGAGELLNASATAVDRNAATTASVAKGTEHHILGDPLPIPVGDVEIGSWDYDARAFTPELGTDPDVVRAVRVTGKRTTAQNGPIPLLLGRVVGVTDIDVSTVAVAHRSFAGTAGPGLVDLPIGIDCCKLVGTDPAAQSNCGDNKYCDFILSPPNPCTKDSDGSTVSCLEFFSSPEQNSCWTEFDPDNPGISVPGLSDIVEDGNPIEIGPEPIFADNGTKTPIVQDIYDRFQGEGSFYPDPDPNAVDYDSDGIMDSWTVTLPVLECQNPGDGCASGEPQYVVGFVCFDIQEIVVTPDKIIRGEFVCPTDTVRFARCRTGGFGPGGTVNTGIPGPPVLVW